MRVLIALIMFLCSNFTHADLSDMFKQLETILINETQQEVNNDVSQIDFNEIEIGPNGIEASCNKLYKNASNDQFNIKSKDWTQEIVDFLKMKNEMCSQQKIAATNTDKYPYVIESEKRNADWINLTINKHYENALSERKQKLKSDENFKIMQDVAECRKSDKHELYTNENMVVTFQQAVNDHKAIQKKEREIANESGVRNLALERNIAERLIFYRDLRDAHFKQYMRYGGKVSVAEKVTRVTVDPCK